MKNTLILITLFLTISSFGQQQQKPFIEVTGVAEREIIPNEIYIDIFIKERLEKGRKVSIEMQENQLKKALQTIGIPVEDLSVSDINAIISKTGWWQKSVLSQANYELKVLGAPKLKQLFEQFEKLKIIDARISKATHSEIEKLRKENRILAIKAAKEKADYLLNAIGEKTGKPIVVNELKNNNPQNYAFTNTVAQNNYSYKISKSITKNAVTQFQKLKIKSSIYVKFSIL